MLMSFLKCALNNFFSKAEQFVLRLALLILLVIALSRLIIGEFHR
jgi:hypothetical protein